MSIFEEYGAFKTATLIRPLLDTPKCSLNPCPAEPGYTLPL